MKSSNAITCMLGACLATAFLAPESLGLICLLGLLPYARAQANEKTWVSLQGSVSESYSLTSLSAINNTIISSGTHNRGHPHYDGVITVLNTEGELTQNLMLEAGSNVQFYTGTVYNNSIISAGAVAITQTNALLCETNLNGTLLDCFEFTGLTRKSRIYGVLGASDNTLLCSGDDAFIAGRHPNNTLKFAYRYPLSNSVTFNALAETEDHNYIFNGVNKGAIFSAYILKTNSNGEMIWAQKLESSDGTHLWTNAVTTHKNTIIMAGTTNQGNSGLISTLDSTTGQLLSATVVSGEGRITFQGATRVNNEILAVGRRRIFTSPNRMDAIIFFNNTVYTISGEKNIALSTAAVDNNHNILLGGATEGCMLTLKLDQNLKLDAAALPPGLEYKECSNDFQINHFNESEMVNSNITISNITNSITPIELTPSTYFKSIIDEISVSHPLENVWLHAPTSQPSSVPSEQPTANPTTQPSSEPTVQPSSAPSAQPVAMPTTQPSSAPSADPTTQPSGEPSAQPAADPTTQPSSKPSNQPSSRPSAQPSEQPSEQPSSAPSADPTTQPSGAPSAQPAAVPTTQPSSIPSAQPAADPTTQPSGVPTAQPMANPSTQPIANPTTQPSSSPSNQPSSRPSAQPSEQPSEQPSGAPSANPTTQPSGEPTAQPSGAPSAQPAAVPTAQPSSNPSSQPSSQPSAQPSWQPSEQPSSAPSAQPAAAPTTQPSSSPSNQPSSRPSAQPSEQPSEQPSGAPSADPTTQPSSAPSAQPTTQPSKQPNAHPSVSPTPYPSVSFAPTISTPSNWTAQINSKSFFYGYGAYELAIVNKQTIVCGGMLPGVCFELSRINGALLSSYSMPWDITNAMTGVGDSVAVLGQGNGKPPYTIALFNPKTGTFPWISTTSSQYARWQAIDYDSITQQLVAVGLNDKKNAVFAFVDPKTGALTAKQYSMPSADLYMKDVTIFPFYAGFCMSGYTIEADYTSNMILMLVDSSNKLTAVNKLKRGDMPISAQWNEINRIAVIDKTNPAVKDVVLVGKTQEPDTTTKAFIAFVRSGMFPTVNSLKLNMGQSSQFTHVMIEDKVAVVTGSFVDKNKQEYAIFLSVDITTGMPLSAKGISSPGRSHCYSIIATDYGYEASCSMNDQTTVFVLDSNFGCGILPPEYAQIDLMQAINQQLESFNLLISSVPLSTIPEATVLPAEAFTLQTHEKATWLSLKQLWPENLPTSAPSQAPTNKPTVYPTPIFTSKPTLEPSYAPIPHPVANPTMIPSAHPSATPTNPTSVPSSSTPTLTYRPSRHPSYKPSQQPTNTPSFEPTRRPIVMPTHRPEVAPTNEPTNKQTPVPTSEPSSKPHVTPLPTTSTERPSGQTVDPSSTPTSPPIQTPAQQQGEKAKKTTFTLGIVLGAIAFAGIIGRIIWKYIHYIQRFFNGRVAPQETTPNTPNTPEVMPVHLEEHDADHHSSSHSINSSLNSSSYDVDFEDLEEELEPWDVENNISSNSSSSLSPDNVSSVSSEDIEPHTATHRSSSLSSNSLPSVSSEDIDEASEPGDIENLKRPF